MPLTCWARGCSANAAAMSPSSSRSSLYSGLSSYSASLMSCRSRPCGLRLRFCIGLGVVDRLENGDSDNRSYDDAMRTDGKSTDGNEYRARNKKRL